MMGVNAISVEAMPALVYCTAMSEKPTPTKGPKMVVAVATDMPLASCSASRNGDSPSRKYISNVNPTMPAIQRTKLALKGISHDGTWVMS